MREATRTAGGHRVIAEGVQRAWKDEAFRDEFIANPKGTIEKYSGQKLPDELKFVALAEDDKTIYFVIPAKPANTDELSDEDLEKVAGGIDIFTASIIAIAAISAACGGVAGANWGTRTNHGW